MSIEDINLHVGWALYSKSFETYRRFVMVEDIDREFFHDLLAWLYFFFCLWFLGHMVYQSYTGALYGERYWLRYIQILVLGTFGFWLFGFGTERYRQTILTWYVVWCIIVMVVYDTRRWLHWLWYSRYMVRVCTYDAVQIFARVAAVQQRPWMVSGAHAQDHGPLYYSQTVCELCGFV